MAQAAETGEPRGEKGPGRRSRGGEDAETGLDVRQLEGAEPVPTGRRLLEAAGGEVGAEASAG